MNSASLSIHPRFLGALLTLGLVTALPAPQVLALTPCCNIVSIDKATGIVTLRDNKTGKLEKVTVKDPAQLAKLTAGQATDRSIGLSTER